MLACGNGPTADLKFFWFTGSKQLGKFKTQKTTKNINSTIIKETDETYWRFGWSSEVATNIHLDQKRYWVRIILYTQ